MDDPLTLAHSVNRFGNWHLNIEKTREALGSHQEALAIFQHLHDARGIAETLDLLGMTSYLGGDLIGGTAYYQQAIVLFRELGDKPGLTSSLATLTLRGPTFQTDTMASAASLAEAYQDAEHALSIAREIGRRSDEAYALMQVGLSRGSQGEYEYAFEAMKQSLQIAEQIEHRQWMTFGYWEVGVLYLDLLALPEARQHLEQALGLAQEIGSWHWVRMVTGFLARAYLLQQDFTKTEAVLTAALEADAAMQTIGQRLVWATRAELALARGDPGPTLDITERLITSAANLSNEHVIPRLWKLRGETLAALGRVEEAETTLRAAQEAAQAQGLRPLLWRIYVALGKLYQTQARQAEAEQAFATARTLIEELAANLPDERVREHFLSQATAMLPRSPLPQSSFDRPACNLNT
jgi:tetratricopeptide (TPR) repeat protein